MLAEYSRTNDGDLIGPMGWGLEAVTEAERTETERRLLAEAQADMPVAWSPRPRQQPPAALVERLEALHQKNNMSFKEGSVDCRLITELAFGEVYKWPGQLIGSCVASGGMRAWTLSALWQIMVAGQPEEPLGKTRLGFNTVAPFGPYNYGAGRKRGNMRGGDGSYCSVHVASFQKDGVIDCNTAALQRIVGSNERDYPETQDTRLYRAFGDWQYLSDLAQYADYRLLEAVEVTDADQSVRLLRDFKPHMICSNWGFGPTSEKVNGYTIYKRSGSWAHNMTIAGVIVANGKLYIIVLNSWGPSAHRDGEIFVIPIELYAQWLRNADAAAIGDIDLPKSAPLI